MKKDPGVILAEAILRLALGDGDTYVNQTETYGDLALAVLPPDNEMAVKFLAYRQRLKEGFGG